jgi:hypothetical protein
MFLSKGSADFKLLKEILSPFFPNVLVDVIGSYVIERFFYITHTTTTSEHRKVSEFVTKDKTYTGYRIYTEEQLQRILQQISILPLYIYEAYVPNNITLIPRYIYYGTRIGKYGVRAPHRYIGSPRCIVRGYMVDEMVLSEPYDLKSTTLYEKLNITILLNW